MSTLSQIRTAVRTDILDDTVAPYLWSDLELNRAASRVVNDFCRLARIIKDGVTSTETVATGTITLAGTVGQIDSVKINGVTVTSAAVPFNATLTQTATDLAANITAYASTPNYSAASAVAVLTVSAAAGTASTPNGYVITVTCSGGMSATVTNMTGGTALTQLAIVAGQGSYQLDPRIIDIDDGDVRLSTLEKELQKHSYRSFQNVSATWDTDASEPMAFCLDWKEGWLTLDCVPEAADTAKMRVFRLPLADLSADADTPEIPNAYHDFITDGMAYYLYSKQDSQTYDPKAADKYYNLCFNPQNPQSHINRIKKMENSKRSGRAQSTTAIHRGCN